MLNEGVRGLGEEGLPTVSSGTDARRPMHVQADITIGGTGGLARMQAHAYTGAFGHSDASLSRCWYRINTLSRVPLYLAHRSANI